MKFARLLLLLAWCFPAGLRAQPTTSPLKVPTTQEVCDLSGKAVTPLVVPADHRAVLLLFIASDCPISNSYAPTMADFCQTFSPKGIGCYAVYCDGTLTAANARAHHDQYHFPCDALLDPKQQLAKVVAATCTPQAVVVGAGGEILYSGRIDDLYAAIGRKRFAVTTHELRDVLSQIVSGQTVTVPWMPAIGCEIN